MPIAAAANVASATRSAQADPTSAPGAASFRDALGSVTRRRSTDRPAQAGAESSRTAPSRAKPVQPKKPAAPAKSRRGGARKSDQRDDATGLAEGVAGKRADKAGSNC